MAEKMVPGGVVVGLFEEEPKPAEEPKAEKPKAKPRKKSAEK